MTSRISPSRAAEPTFAESTTMRSPCLADLTGLLAVALLAVGFLAAGFLGVLTVVFLAVVFLAVGFLAAGFLGVLTVVFLAVVLAVGFLAVAFRLGLFFAGTVLTSRIDYFESAS